MKKLVIASIVSCCCSTSLFAQENAIDRYLGSAPIPTIIASSTDNILAPQDLDFCRVPGRENELWVLNKGDANGGSVVIIYDAGKPTGRKEYRRDSHAAHFMRNASAIAMSENGNFGTSGEIQNTNGSAVSTFMGPTLWTSDTSVFARVNQNDWVEGELLGSHSDMMHESPFSMGIAADTGNVYWVFDGYHGAINRYSFSEPHGYGEDDHGDGLVYKYMVPVDRTSNLPSHMVLDQASGWLYVVDNGTKRIIRVQTGSGVLGEDLPMENESLVEYIQMDEVVWETIDSNITRLCGIDLFDGRLLVTENTTGNIRIYNTTTPSPTYMGMISTGEAGIMGVKIGPDSAIWYVNKTKNKVVRLAPGEQLAVGDPTQAASATLFPNPASTEINLALSQPALEISIVNAVGQTVKTFSSLSLASSIDVRDLPNGAYYCLIRGEQSSSIMRFVVSR